MREGEELQMMPGIWLEQLGIRDGHAPKETAFIQQEADEKEKQTSFVLNMMNK
jgi:hypothetical protein